MANGSSGNLERTDAAMPIMSTGWYGRAEDGDPRMTACPTVQATASIPEEG